MFSVLVCYVVLFICCFVICFGFLLGGGRLRCLKKRKYLGQNAKYDDLRCAATTSLDICSLLTLCLRVINW